MCLTPKLFTSNPYKAFNSLPNDKILDLTNFKAFAGGKLNVAKTMISSFDGLKTLWEKEKMLVTSIFSFSHNVFKSPISSGC